MRAWWLSMVGLVSACSCEDKRVEPAARPPPAEAPAVVKPVAPPAPLDVKLTWVQQRLTPQKTELQAQVEYGPTTSALEVQLEPPAGVQVTRGRTYFRLEPAAERKVHVEAVTVTSDALPVKDLVLVVRGGGAEVREAYRFGRR